MKGRIAFAVCGLVFGLWLGSIRFPSVGSDSDSIVTVDLCFLIRNPDLIGSRRFITSAILASALPHGSVLESGSCPRRGASFTEQLDSPDFTAQLDQTFKNEPYGSVPVLFEGTLHGQSLLRQVWFKFVNRFGIYDKTELITIRKFRAVGNQGDSTLIQLPDSHP